MGIVDAPARCKLSILMPVYDDWTCACKVVQELDRVLSSLNKEMDVLIVDDCSTTSPPDCFLTTPPKCLAGIEILRLRRNLGHQRAIAIGLSYLFTKNNCSASIVMDADGEDKPEDVLPLLCQFEASKGEKVVFAARARRSEGWRFKFFYHAYRHLHRVLTGIPVRVGNFSVLGRCHLAALMVVPDLWNHYAASVFKAKIPFEMVPLERGRRLDGKSKLNFIGLVTHGLSAISVFADTVGVRITLTVAAMIALLVSLLVCVVAVRLGTNLAIPGWATSAAGFLLVLMLQMLTVALGLTLAALFSRNSLSFLPIRDYHYFIGEVRKLYERA